MNALIDLVQSIAVVVSICVAYLHGRRFTAHARHLAAHDRHLRALEHRIGPPPVEGAPTPD